MVKKRRIKLFMSSSKARYNVWYIQFCGDLVVTLLNFTYLCFVILHFCVSGAESDAHKWFCIKQCWWNTVWFLDPLLCNIGHCNWHTLSFCSAVRINQIKSEKE
jgi:uncharacterized membrane protein